MSSGYLRYPHIRGDLLTFTAGDDVWLAPAAGGRAWRLSADDVPVSYPRFSRDGSRVAWTSWRDGNPEVYSAEADGSAAARLTYWGDPQTRVTGWTTAGEVLALTAANQPAAKYRRAYAVPGDGTPPRLLPFGAVSDVAIEEAGTALLTGSVVGEPAFWKRYRGGRAGKLWTATAGDPLFTRVLADLDGQLASPMIIGGRLFFLSDHEGTGNIYSCALDGSDVYAGTPITTACTPGTRPPTGSGSCTTWPGTSGSWTARTRRSRGGWRYARLPGGGPGAAADLGERPPGRLDCDRTGQASVVEVRGTVHWLTHKDGPARALHVDPVPGRGCRGCSATPARWSGSPTPPAPTRSRSPAWTAPAGGARGEGAGETGVVRLAEGLLGHVTSLAASPDGATVAAAAHDGRLLAVDVASGQVTELASVRRRGRRGAVLVAGLGLAGLVPARDPAAGPDQDGAR